MTTANPATITTDGITVTATDDPAMYEVSGPRVSGTVQAHLYIDERGGDEYRNGQRVSVPTEVIDTQVGYRSERDNAPYLIVNGIEYVGSYARTATGRYVGATIDRKDGGKVTDNARAIIYGLASAVATLHATPANVNARKLQDAKAAVATARAKVTEANNALTAARRELRLLDADATD